MGVLLSRPRSAPGPSEELQEREATARLATEEAQDAAEATAKAAADATSKAAAGAAAEGATADAKVELDADAIAQQKLAIAMQRLQEVEEELSAAESDLEQYPVPEYLRESCRGGMVNICVTGASGVGKSSWINAIRRLASKDPGAARTGVTETTTDPQRYTFPGTAGVIRRSLGRVSSRVRKVWKGLTGQRPPQEAEDETPIKVGDRLLLQNCDEALNGKPATVSAALGGDMWDVHLADGEQFRVGRHQVTGVLAECVIWDLPGVGTPKFPQKTYLREMGIRHFDMVVLMTASRFTEAELVLAEELRRWQVPFFCVRNKVDADVEQEIEKEEESGEDLGEEGRLSIERQTLGTIKSYFETEFGLHDVYCVSTRRKLRDQFDFHRLEADMEVVLKKQRLAPSE